MFSRGVIHAAYMSKGSFWTCGEANLRKFGIEDADAKGTCPVPNAKLVTCLTENPGSSNQVWLGRSNGSVVGVDAGGGGSAGSRV